MTRSCKITKGEIWQPWRLNSYRNTFVTYTSTLWIWTEMRPPTTFIGSKSCREYSDTIKIIFFQLWAKIVFLRRITNWSWEWRTVGGDRADLSKIKTEYVHSHLWRAAREVKLKSWRILCWRKIRFRRSGDDLRFSIHHALLSKTAFNSSPAFSNWMFLYFFIKFP